MALFTDNHASSRTETNSQGTVICVDTSLLDDKVWVQGNTLKEGSPVLLCGDFVGTLMVRHGEEDTDSQDTIVVRPTFMNAMESTNLEAFWKVIDERRKLCGR